MHKVSKLQSKYYLVEDTASEPMSLKLWKTACKGLVKPVSSISPTGLIGFFSISARKISSTDDIIVKKKLYKNTKYYVLSCKDPYRRAPTTIFYLHGGANVLKLSDGHVNLAKDLVLESGATVVLIDYLVVPKYDHSTIFGQAYELFLKYARAAKSGAKRLVLMGDSAGAGMAASMALKVHDDDLGVNIDRMILVSPWLDLSMSNPDIASKLARKDVILHKKFLRRAGRDYAGILGVEHPYVSPMFGDLDKLPPMMVISSDMDILNPDAIKWVEKAKAAHIDVVYYEYRNEMHDFLAFTPERFHYLVEQMSVFLQG